MAGSLCELALVEEYKATRSTSPRKQLIPKRASVQAGLMSQRMDKSNCPALCSPVFVLCGSTGIPQEHFRLADSTLLKYVSVACYLRKFSAAAVTLHLSALNSTCYFITATQFGNLLLFTFSVCSVSLRYFDFDGSSVRKSSTARCSLGSVTVNTESRARTENRLLQAILFCGDHTLGAFACTPSANWSSSTLTACLRASTLSSLLSQAL